MRLQQQGATLVADYGCEDTVGEKRRDGLVMSWERPAWCLITLYP